MYKEEDGSVAQKRSYSLNISFCFRVGLVKIVLSILLLNLFSSNLYCQPQEIANLNVLGAEFGDYEIKINKSNLGKFSDCREHISIAGMWQVQLDQANRGVAMGLQNGLTNYQPIELPGILDEAKIGVPEPISQSKFTRKYRYVGAAWYQREITIPEQWRNREVMLWLDRVMWESRLYIDGNLVGSEESLSTSHVYNLGMLSPGKHKIVLRIDNAGRSGASCHGYGTDIQIQWNGVVGKMELIARDKTFINEMNIYPDITSNSVVVTAKIRNNSGVKVTGEFAVALHKKDDSVILAKSNAWLRLSANEYMVSVRVPFEQAERWSEFNPVLYQASGLFVGQGDGDKYHDTKTVTFGMREIANSGKKLLLNGQSIYLRGTNDCAGFAMLGYIPTDKKSWIERFGQFKQYGLNHIRFHSVCPPKGAFEAADELGMYLQVELPHWGNIDQSWEGSGFLQRELDCIVAQYGNHPSFCMLTMGNEHNGNWDYLDRMTERIKKVDNRHLYAAVSNPYIRPTDEQQSGRHDDFCLIMWGDNLSGKRHTDRIRYMERLAEGGNIERDKDYSQEVAPFPVPFLGHELGQYWIYPDFDRIGIHNGVLVEGNLTTFKSDVQKKGLMTWADKFRRASGKEAIQLYKEDIERFLRTSNTAGYQLLDVKDYPGHGTALVGALFDSYGVEKNHVTADEFKAYCAPIVILSRIAKIAYVSGDTLKIPIEIFNYSQSDLHNQTLEWRVKTGRGRVLMQGSIPNISASQGGNTPIGTIGGVLNIDTPEELTVDVKLKESQISNQWKTWAYLLEPKVEKGADGIKVVTKIDEQVLDYVAAGGRLLYTALEPLIATQVDFINAIWTPGMLENRTCGSLINNSHPLFKEFPTEEFSDLQWMNLLKKSRGFILNATPQEFTPIAWAIECPSSMRNSKVGTIVEMRFGKGIILATSLHMKELDIKRFPEVKQLRQSMLNYLASANINKIPKLDKETILEIFAPSVAGFHTAPDQQERTLLEILPLKNAAPAPNLVWERKLDKVAIKNDGYDYRLCHTADETYAIKFSSNGKNVTEWDLSRKTLEISCPDDFSGNLYLKFDITPKTEGYVDFYPYTCKINNLGFNNYMCVKISPKMVVDGKVRLNFTKSNYPMKISHLLLTAPNLDVIKDTKSNK